jgi:hypothetical protein
MVVTPAYPLGVVVVEHAYGEETDEVMTGDETGRAGSVGLGEWVRTRRPAQRWVLAVLLVVYVVGMGVVGFGVAWSDDPGPPLPPVAWVQWPSEVQPLFGEETTGGSGLRGAERNHRVFYVGDHGQLHVETVYVGQPLPDAVPRRPRPPLTPQDRHERDLAFAAGENAYQQWREEQGFDQPPAPPLERGPVFADLEVDCVRVVLSGTDVADPDPGALAELSEMIQQRIRAWLDDPTSGEVCQQVWWYDHD